MFCWRAFLRIPYIYLHPLDSQLGTCDLSVLCYEMLKAGKREGSRWFGEGIGSEKQRNKRDKKGWLLTSRWQVGVLVCPCPMLIRVAVCVSTCSSSWAQCLALGHGAEAASSLLSCWIPSPLAGSSSDCLLLLG